MGKKLTTEEFIERATKVHGDEYDYSLVEYVGAHIKIKIICKEHGIFEQIPSSHLKYQGCRQCKNKVYRETKLKSNKQYLTEIKKIHGDKYEYLSDYVDEYTKLKIKCKECDNIFIQKPSKHKSGQGCPICGELKRIESRKLSLDEFVKRAKEKHDNYYDYSKADYINMHTKIKIICLKHGLFEQTPDNHLSGKGCAKCKKSKGENAISKLLNEHNIIFTQEQKFKDCKDKRELPFDFYLPENNLCIEYDGKQHFTIVDYFGGKDGLKKIQKHDKIKNQYCLDNNIDLIRIRYDEDVSEKLDFLIKNQHQHNDKRNIDY